MKAYSEDLRRKIVDVLNRGTPKSEAARLFGVSLSSVKRFARMEREGGSLAPRKTPEGRREGGEAACGRSRRAPGGDRVGAAALSGASHGRFDERIYGEETG